MLVLLTLAVTAVAAYQGQLVWRLGGAQNRTYAGMLLAIAAVGLVAVAGQAGDEATPFVRFLGFAAVVSFVCLVIVPSFLRDHAAWALERGRVGWARWLLTARQLLQPGTLAQQEREDVDTMHQVREGRVDQALAALHERRRATHEPLLVRALDERIVWALIFARRWSEATAHFDRALKLANGPVSARLLVEMVVAFCETGEVDRASEWVSYLERSPVAGEPTLAPLLLRARMALLAFVGFVDDVILLVGGLPGDKSARAGLLGHMGGAERAYWIGVARMAAGDLAGARAALVLAHANAKGEPERAGVHAKLAELAKLESAPPPDQTAPADRSPDVVELATQVAVATRERAQQGTAPLVRERSLSRTPVTLAFVVVNLLVAVLIAAGQGTGGVDSLLVRAGANVRPFVWSGEYWRLAASTLLHFNALHLLLNVYGLWILGRLLEPMLGRVPFLIVLLFSGVGGALASDLYGASPYSVGASGGVFGLLGALIAELTLRRRHYPVAWRRLLLNNLIFLVLLNLGLGAISTGDGVSIDQAAHIGGFLLGALLAALLAQKSALGRRAVGKWVHGVLLIACAAIVVYGGVGVARNLGRAWQTRVVGGARLELPSDFIAPVSEGQAVSIGAEHSIIVMYVQVNEKRTIQHDVDGLASAEAKRTVDARRLTGAVKVRPSAQFSGWATRELMFVDERAPSTRLLIFARVQGPHEYLVSFELKDSELPRLLRLLPRILPSVRPA